MKHKFIIFLCLLFSGAADMNAQGWTDILKNAVSSSASSTGNSTVSGMVDNLLGTSTISAKSIAGIWIYKEPAVVFESEDMLTSLGSSAVAGTIQEKMQTNLNKIGFTPGKVELTLNKNGTGYIKVDSRKFYGKWSVSGTDLTISLTTSNGSKLSKSYTMNVNLTGNKLQVAMKADKFLAFVKTLIKAGSIVNSSLATVSSLSKNVDGLYLGLQFNRK